MILKRLGNAIVSRNWNIVLVEITIVVVGIFLGLQVDDWNEHRKERQQEALYLDKLLDDLITMHTALTIKIESHHEIIQRMSASLFALEECRISEETQSDLSFTLEIYQVSGVFHYLSATFDEMVASGALARLEDQVLKQQIAETFSLLANLSANQRSFRISIPVVDEIVWKSVSYSVDRETGRSVVAYEMSELCGDVELRNAIVEMIDINRDSRGGARRSRDAGESLIANLEAAAGSDP